MTDNNILTYEFQSGFDDALMVALDTLTDLMELEQHDKQTLLKAYEQIEKQAEKLIRVYQEVGKSNEVDSNG